MAHRLCNTGISQPFRGPVRADVQNIDAQDLAGGVEHLPHTSDLLDALQHPDVYRGFSRE